MRLGNTCLALTTLLFLACGTTDDGNRPGGASIAGRVVSVLTDGGGSRGGITVTIVGDREEITTTDEAGFFLVPDAPTGDIVVFFTSGSCRSGIPLNGVPSRSALSLENIEVRCDGSTAQRVLESFRGVLLNEPTSRFDDLDLCTRFGRDNDSRRVAARDARIEEDGFPALFDGLAPGDLLEVAGERAPSGGPGTLRADRIEVLDHGVTDACGLF